MKIKKMIASTIMLCGILLISAAGLLGPVSAATTAETAASYVAVTKLDVEPESFVPDDTGTIRVEISNSGSVPVSIYRAEILSSDIRVLNYQTYDSIGAIGPGNTMQFTFNVQPAVGEGMYFPIFYLDYTDAGSLRYPVPLDVDSTPLIVSIVNAPASLSAGTKEQVTLSVSNPRENAVNSVTVTPGGDGIQSTQSSIFIGTLEPDAEEKVTFEITADRDTILTFDVSYRNGNNLHHINLPMPVTVGDGGTAAEMIVNNLEVTQSGSTFTLAGDITNAGLRDAKSVKVTVGSPATPVDPNPVYVIGALEPDDFSSFEITCTAQGASTVPLVIQYRDTDGTVFEKTVDISVRSTSMPASGAVAGGPQGMPAGNPGRQGGMFGFGNGVSKIPFTEIIIVIVACIAVAVAWRKGYLAKAVGMIRNRSGR